jgi:hypothetical protein
MHGSKSLVCSIDWEMFILSPDRVLFLAANEYKDTIEKLIELTMGSILAVSQEPINPNFRVGMGEGPADSHGPNLGGWLFGLAQRGNLKTKITTSIE